MRIIKNRFGMEINVVTGEATRVELPDLIEEEAAPAVEEPANDTI